MKDVINKLLMIIPLLLGLIPIDGINHLKDAKSFHLTIESKDSNRVSPIYTITKGELYELQIFSKKYQNLVTDSVLLSAHGFSKEVIKLTLNQPVFVNGEIEYGIKFGENRHIALIKINEWKIKNYIPSFNKWNKLESYLYCFCFLLGLAIVIADIVRKKRQSRPDANTKKINHQ